MICCVLLAFMAHVGGIRASAPRWRSVLPWAGDAWSQNEDWTGECHSQILSVFILCCNKVLFASKITNTTSPGSSSAAGAEPGVRGGDEEEGWEAEEGKAGASGWWWGGGVPRWWRAGVLTPEHPWGAWPGLPYPWTLHPLQAQPKEPRLPGLWQMKYRSYVAVYAIGSSSRQEFFR